MRCIVYVPTQTHSSNPNVTNASSVEVDVEQLEALFEKLSDEAPEGTRVVAFQPNGTHHYVLDKRGLWRQKMQVIVA